MLKNKFDAFNHEYFCTDEKATAIKTNVIFFIILLNYQHDSRYQ